MKSKTFSKVDKIEPLYFIDRSNDESDSPFDYTDPNEEGEQPPEPILKDHLTPSDLTREYLKMMELGKSDPSVSSRTVFSRPRYKDETVADEEEKMTNPSKILDASDGISDEDHLSRYTKNSAVDKIKKYEETHNVSWIYLLLKDHFYNSIEDALCNDRELSEEEIDDFTTSSTTHIVSLLSPRIRVSAEFRDRLRDIFYSFWSDSTGYYKMQDLTINTLEEYLEVLKMAKRYGVNINEDIYPLREEDFSKLRDEGGSIRLIYSITENLLMFSGYIMTGHTGVRAFKNVCEDLLGGNLEENEKITSEDDNTIVLNGLKYSKKAFESLIESKFDIFVQNLEIESILDGNDIAEAVDEPKTML